MTEFHFILVVNTKFISTKIYKVLVNTVQSASFNILLYTTYSRIILTVCQINKFVRTYTQMRYVIVKIASPFANLLIVKLAASTVKRFQ